MFATFKMVFVYVTLGTVAGVIGIPYSVVVGNVELLYRLVVRKIVPWGVRAAGIRVEGGEGVGGGGGGGGVLGGGGGEKEFSRGGGFFFFLANFVAPRPPAVLFS